MSPSSEDARASEPTASWECRWCRGTEGRVLLDAGRQAAADAFPHPDDPLPDPVYPLRMVMCSACHLAQLESDPTTPDEPRGLEPKALTDQAAQAVTRLDAEGVLADGGRALEYPSPHGGSWLPLLARQGYEPADDDGPVDVIIDTFGMMHDPDQRAALQERVTRLSDSGVLLLQFHSLAAILRSRMWNALRHGHYAYYSTPWVVAAAKDHGLTPVGCWQFPLYGGTVLLALSREGSPSPRVADLVQRERAEGVLDPVAVADLQDALSDSARVLAAFLESAERQGDLVMGYGAASRAVALLQSAGATRSQVAAIADAAPSKHGRAMPASRIPIVAPSELTAMRPTYVLVTVPDLVDEVRAALPEVEASGGRWVVVDRSLRPLEPAPLHGTTRGGADRRLGNKE